MKIFLTVVGIIFVLFIAALLYFYRFAFVRFGKEDTDDLDSPSNRLLKPYKDIIKAGFDYVENHPHSWVHTESFDGLCLAARYFPCDNSNRTVILFHGYRSSAKRDFSCAVEMYNKMGLNVLLCDQRSHGKSEGKLITFGVKERRDVFSWIDFLLENYGHDTEIFLGGMSMGATTVLLSAGLGLPHNVKGIVADCGFTSPYDIIKNVAKRTFHIPSWIFCPAFELICRAVGGFGIYGVSTVDALKENRVPVLFIHGKADNFVPCEMSVRGYDAAVGEKKIYLVEGAGHGFSYLIDTEGVRNEIENFITSH